MVRKMKKRILRKEFYMEIRKSFGRFLSIFLIVALEVSFFAGIRASEPDMRLSGDEYFDERNLADLKVVSTMGLTKEDAAALEKTEGIRSVEYGYSVDAMCNTKDKKKVVHIMSDLKDMNKVDVEEGRMPRKENECFVDIDFLKDSGYKVGDEIVLESGTDTPLTDSLKSETYKIVGAGSSPCYISFERGSSAIGTGEVSGFLIVPEQAFAMDVYTEIYMTVEDAFDEVAFTKEYESAVEKTMSRVEAMKEERQKARRDEIVANAEKEIKKAEDELAKHREEFEKGKAELEQGKQKLKDAKAQLPAMKEKADKQLAAARQKLKDGEAQIAAAKKQVADGEAQLKNAKKLLETKKKELEAGQKSYDDGVGKLNQAKEVVAQNEAKLNEMKASVAQLEKGIQETEAKITKLEEEILKFEPTFTEAQKKYEAIKKQYEDALKEWEEGTGNVTEEQLEALKKAMEEEFKVFEPIDKKMKELKTADEEAKKALEELQKQLLDLQKVVEQGEKELSAGKSQIATTEKQLSDAKAKLGEGQKQIENGAKEIAANEKKLPESKEAIKQSEKKISDGWKSYEKEKKNVENQLAAANSELAKKEKELADAEAKLLEAEKELTRGVQEIEKAKKEAKEIRMPKWYVSDRDAFVEYTGYGANADRIRAIGKVFPVLFFLVAALISLTTMTRMVEEQRVQIGTLKALGYSKVAIAGKYLGYAFAATLGGSILGVLVGEKLYPYIVVTAYKIMYPHLPNVVIPYNLKYAVMATVAAILCTMAATIFACYKELEAQPAVLMRPPAPKQGKRVFLERVTFIWKHLSFTWKSTIRNLIRYKKRFFMTVFGIGGCMALLLVGYGLRDSIYNIAVIQYEDIQKYDMLTILDEDASEEEKQELQTYIEEESGISGKMNIYMKNMTIGKGIQEEEAYVFVPEQQAKFKDFVSLQDRKTKEKYELTDEGAVLSEKMAKTLNVEVGDSIYIQDENSEKKEVKIATICENYMGHYLYFTEKTYESLFGVKPEYNAKIFQMEHYNEKEALRIGEKMLATEAAINVQYMDSMRGRIEDMLTTLDRVIVVLIAAAGMLAFVVLYNLNNINITERRRELATIKVLGFYDKEVAAYVYRENVLLTIIGAIAGCGLGYLLHRFVIVTVEVEDVMFGRNIEPKSYLIAMLFTIGFSLFVNWVMYFKLKKIDMVESMKSVE